MIPCRRRSGFLICSYLSETLLFSHFIYSSFIWGLSHWHFFKLFLQAQNYYNYLEKMYFSIFFCCHTSLLLPLMTTKYICSAVVPFISGSVLKRGGLKHGDIPCITEPCFKKRKKGWRENPAAAAFSQGWRGPACLIPQIKSSSRVAVGSRGSMKSI